MNIYKKIKKKIKKPIISAYNTFIPRYNDVINIILWKGSKGLYKDASILVRVLSEAGFRPRMVNYKTETPLLKCRLNIFIQYIYPQFLKYAKSNILIPNPEWGDDGFKFINDNFDCVIAKTLDCKNIFEKHVTNLYYTSFTSDDVFENRRMEKTYAHFAGKSKLKGTKKIINLWNNNNDLPTLHLYSYDVDYSSEIKTNKIVYSYEKLEDEKIKYLQNTHLFHLSPSEYEGFGHQLNESKSAGGIVFTTDAPPMNELIKNDFGYLIEPNIKGWLKKAPLYSFSEDGLRQKIFESKELSKEAIEEKCMHARLSFEKNDNFFKNSIKTVVSKYF